MVHVPRIVTFRYYAPSSPGTMTEHWTGHFVCSCPGILHGQGWVFCVIAKDRYPTRLRTGYLIGPRWVSNIAKDGYPQWARTGCCMVKDVFHAWPRTLCVAKKQVSCIIAKDRYPAGPRTGILNGQGRVVVWSRTCFMHG
jgi:hypothetical protein